MAAAVAEDPKILSGGDGEAGLVEGTELHRIAVEWGFEGWHFLGFWGFWKNRDLLICFLLFGSFSSGYVGSFGYWVNPYPVMDLEILLNWLRKRQNRDH